MALPSSIVNPTFAGEISPGRSIIAISCSMGLPATTSATSFIVHFIHRAYATPQLCMLSMFTNLYSFQNGTDQAYPSSGLTLGSNGSFFGTTWGDGWRCCGN